MKLRFKLCAEDTGLMELEYQAFPFDGECGVCGNRKMELRRVTYPSQNFELIVIVCGSCGHRETSIVDTGGGHPKRQVVLVKGSDDLDTLVYRSPQADILVPELGLELYHTLYTQPRITTIEGFLREAKQKVESLFSRRESARFLAKLDEALSGNLKLTFILVDESGASWVAQPAKRH